MNAALAVWDGYDAISADVARLGLLFVIVH